VHVLSSVLFFNDVFDLSQFGLFADPDLDEALGGQLVADDVELGRVRLVLRNAVDASDELDRNVLVQVCS